MGGSRMIAGPIPESSGAMRRSVLAVGGLSLLVTAAAAVGLVLLAARSTVRRIRTFPDPVALEDLLSEPTGEELIVGRPDGTRLRVQVIGTGRTVVLAHGIALTLGEWNLVAELLLADGYRVVAFDARGHGQSTIGCQGISAPVMAADLAAVLEATHTTDAILVGHSMGGFLALEAVLEVPALADRLAGLVLVASFAGDILDGAPQNRAEAPILRSHLLPRLTANPTIGTLFAASFFGPQPSPVMLTAFLHMILGRDGSPLLPLLDAFTTDDLLGRLPAIDVPTVIVCGLADRTTPPRDSQRLAAAIPGARTVWVPDAGHMLPWEAPGAIRGAVASVAVAGEAGG
jgi:pimeloyl-ACP methyl ester carboxylesterase